MCHRRSCGIIRRCEYGPPSVCSANVSQFERNSLFSLLVVAIVAFVVVVVVAGDIYTPSLPPSPHSFAHYLRASSHALPLIHSCFAKRRRWANFLFTSQRHISFNLADLHFFPYSPAILPYIRPHSQQWPSPRVIYKSGSPRHVVKQRS